MSKKGKKTNKVSSLNLKPNPNSNGDTLVLSHERLRNEILRSRVFKAEDLEILSVIGRGQYGVVRQVRHKELGEIMAMKEIEFSPDEHAIKQTLLELTILRTSQCPQIVSFYGAFVADTSVFYCMEYMDYGSLDKISGSGIPEKPLAYIALEVMKGLHYLAKDLGKVHRDIKPTNILANKKGEIKLCDFGIAGELIQSLAKTFVGCSLYMAPERIDPQFSAEKYTTISDVWSLGITLVELGNGKYPYPSFKSVFDSLNNVLHGETPTLNSNFSKEAQDFVSKCLNKNHRERLDYEALMQHPWIVNLANQNFDMKEWLESRMKTMKNEK